MKNEHQDRLFEKTAPNLHSSEFFECEFKELDLSGRDLLSSRFIGCAFKNCNMSNMIVSGSSFRECYFESCKIIGVNWTASPSLFENHFKDSFLDFCVFQGLSLKETRFINCGLSDTDFSRANLKKASFEESCLRGANFYQCDLTEADFRGAIQYSIDIANNKVKRAKFSMPEALNLLTAFEIELD